MGRIGEQQSQPDRLSCLAGGGEMGALMRSLDWSQTPLGPVASWSPTLQMTVRSLLVNRFPLLLWWGPQYIQLYNDAYRPILGTKHPKSLVQPAHKCWPEIWHIIGPLIDTPFRGGPATGMEDLALELNRYDFFEEAHFSFAYSPVPDETAPGGIGGVVGAVQEITEKVLGERRMAALRDLGARSTTEAKTAEEACSVAAKTLAAYDRDVPFALLYLTDADGKQARLAGAAGAAMGQAIRPQILELDAEGASPWPLAQARRTETLQIVEDLGSRLSSVPPGPWSDPPGSAVVLPIRSSTGHPAAGFLIAGISARLRFDEAYRGFLELAAAQIGTAIANARAYEEEKKRAEALAELDRAKTAFFSNVSHEFRTPLTLMLGPVAELLANDRAGFSSVAAEQLEVVNRNGQRLLRLVNTLLDFARIEAGRVQAVYEPTELGNLTAELASNFRSACERAGLRLTVDCPPLAEPVFVDREMWEKIVLNLLSNAFKFTFEGEITLSLRQRENMVELKVRDTGTGIRAEDMPRLFERFYRVENAQGRTHEGSGIGLALVQELVKLHGGTVSAESAFQRGTKFTVTVPLGSAHLPPDRIGGSRTLASTATGASPYVEEALRWLPDEEAYSPRLAGGRQPPGKPGAICQNNSNRPRVLVADDNADMRQYVVRLLAEHYQVEAVADGEAALAAARERSPDLILTDVMMPRLDGFGLLRELRADPRTLSLPVILLSARAGEESRVEGMEAGADDYLVKPFSARELLARVTAHLQMARLRREAAASLRASEERFQSFMANSPVTAYIKDAQGRYVFVNRLIEQQFKRPLAEWIGRTDLDVFPPDQAEQFRNNDRSVLASHALAQFVETLSQPDGLHHYLSLKFPLQDSNGSWLVAGMSLDMTEQKRTESLLAGQKHVLELVATGRPLSAVLAAVVRIIEEQDPGLLCSVLRLNGEGWRVRIDHKAGLPEYYMQGPDGFVIEPPYLSPCAMVLHSGQEVVVPDIETDERWSVQWRELALGQGLRSCRVTPIFASDGRATAAFAMYSRQPIDLSRLLVSREALIQVATRLAGMAIERRQWLDALRRNEERLQLIMESAKDYAIFTVDLAGRITAWNSGARNLLGYEAAEVIGRNADIVFTPEDRQGGDPERELEKARTEGRAENERWHVRKDGSRFWASGLVMPLKDNNKVLGFLKIMRDRTEQRELEQGLIEADRKKDEFLATLAHELRNPLAPLRNGLHVMKLARHDSNAVEQARSMMERQLSQMVHLIDDLLDVSRITQGKVELRKHRIELAEILQQAVENSRPLIDAGGHELHVELPAEPVFVNADLTRLAQVFSNLLNNAAKYTERGGRITLTTQRLESDVIVRVKDTGIGIPAHMLTKVFDTFAQVDRSLERSQGGLGIGLSLVKGLVEMHGGSVEAYSEGHGRGSEFVVRLPMLPSSVEEQRSEEQGERTASNAPRRILVTDDNQDSATSLAMMLTIMGNDTQTAFDGLEALEVAAAFRPDMILLDIGMPKLNGYDAARRIREQPWGKDVVLVALTGWGQDEDRRRSRDAGFDFHMVKPVDPKALEKVLANVRARTA